MKALTKQMAVAAKDRQPFIREYEIPGPDPATEPRVKVFCRDLASTGYSAVDLIDSMTTGDGKPNKKRQKRIGELRAAHCICDADGNLLFSEEDVFSDWWAKLPDAFKDGLVSVAYSHNSAEVVDVAAALKNSEDAAGEGTVSA